MAKVSTYAVAPTIVEVLRECDAAWDAARKMLASKTMTDTEIYEKLVDAHSELNKTYSVVLSMMANGDYSRKAAERFFKYVQQHPWKNDIEHDETMTIYVAMCLRATQPRISPAEIARARERTRQALKDQRANMKKMMEIAQARADEINARRAQARVMDLRERVPIDAPILVCGENRGISVAFDPSQ